MAFNFQALGLLVMFIIMCFYYYRDINDSKSGGLYKWIMVFTYIMQLVYMLTFIAIKENRFIFLFSKLYFILICIVYSLLSAYFLCLGLKSKYIVKQSVYNDKVKKINNGLIVCNIVTSIIILFSNVYLDGNVVLGSGVNLTMGIQFIYVLISFCVLIKYKGSINKGKYYKLLIIFVISAVILILEYYFRNIPIVGSGCVILTLFMFFVLENSSNKEIERLQLERDHALKINAEKSSFLTNMSHEIRQPLNTIDGFSQVIIDSNDINEIKEDAQDIRIACKDLIEIIDGMIDISIIESGRLEIIKENYNVYDMLDNIINITNSRIKYKDIDFVTSIDKNMPDILFGDATRIEQVLLNILNNAIKYTKKGEVKLNVEAVKSVSMCRLKISVSDTGVGIKKDDLDRIFEGLEDNDGNERDGYSLGLVVSKKLLDLMDGSIDVDSVYGKGSTFVVTLDQRIGTELQVSKEVKKKNIKPFDSKGKRILLVDDNKLNIKVATKLLEPYNVIVKEAFSGQECLDILDKDTNFDLILMDDLMPKMSGSETLNILKKIARIEGFSIPVVVLTANAISGMKNKYLSIGFDDYIAKPIDKGELDRVLRKFIK